MAYFSDHLIFGILYYTLVIDSTTAYTIIFNKAFPISTSFEDAKSRLHARLLKCYTSVYDRKMAKAVRAQLQSVPLLGVQTGTFHTLERTSAPIFFNFCDPQRYDHAR